MANKWVYYIELHDGTIISEDFTNKREAKQFRNSIKTKAKQIIGVIGKCKTKR